MGRARARVSDELDGGFFMTGDGLLVLFHRNVGGTRDLFQATRASLEEPFGTPVPLAELDTPVNDTDPWLSPDRHTLLFSRVVNGADDVFMATR